MRSTPVGGQCALGHPGPDLCAGKLSEFVKAPETCWAPAFTWTPFCIAGVLSLPGRARPAFQPELSLKKARDQGVGHTASLGGDLTASGGRWERRRPYQSSPGTAEKMGGHARSVLVPGTLGAEEVCSGMSSRGCREAPGQGSNRKRGGRSSRMPRSAWEPAGLSSAAAGTPGDHGHVLRPVSGLFIRTAPDGEGRGAPGSVPCVLGDAGRAPGFLLLMRFVVWGNLLTS